VLFAAPGSHSQEVKKCSVVSLTSLMSGVHLSPSIINTMVGKAVISIQGCSHTFGILLSLLETEPMPFRWAPGCELEKLESTWTPAASGVLQRSVLGPILFNAFKDLEGMEYLLRVCR